MSECKHERTTALLDGVSCDDCGAFRADWGWGVASGKWFGSRALADFYMRNGKSPEPQVDDRIAALAAENERLRAALQSIIRFGWPANIETNPEQRMLGGKKPATADVWTFPKHMLSEIEALAEQQVAK